MRDLTMTARKRILILLLAVSPIVYLPISQWIATTHGDNALFRWAASLFSFSALITYLIFAAAVPAFVLLIRDLFRKETRGNAAFYLASAILYFLCLIAGVRLGQQVRMAGMYSFTQRGNALVAAIQKYEIDNDSPPQSLDDLVPKYLPTVPSTGMPAYPDFRYHTGAEARDDYRGNRWALTVFTPKIGINFDMIMYFPDQNYPETGYGGSLERISDWAYVHE